MENMSRSLKHRSSKELLRGGGGEREWEEEGKAEGDGYSNVFAKYCEAMFARMVNKIGGGGGLERGGEEWGGG